MAEALQSEDLYMTGGAKRKTKPTLDMLRKEEERLRTELYKNLAKMNNSENLDVASIRNDSKLLKEWRRNYQKASINLGERLGSAGIREEATELRENRYLLLEECKQMLVHFNNLLVSLGEDLMSVTESSISYESRENVQHTIPSTKKVSSCPSQERKYVHFGDTRYEVVYENGDKKVRECPKLDEIKTSTLSQGLVSSHINSLEEPKEKVVHHLNRQSNLAYVNYNKPSNIPYTKYQRPRTPVGTKQRSPVVENHFQNDDDLSDQLESNLRFQEREQIPLSTSGNCYQESRMTQRLREELLFHPKNPYGGESFTFWSWKNRMQHSIENANLSPLDALYVVQKNTANRPRAIVDNLIATSASPTTTLKIIWDTLTSRFGSTHRLAEELLSKLDKFPVIKVPKSQLTQMEDLLDLCRLIEANIPHSRELMQMNFPSGMDRVLEKLPESLHDRWRKYWHQLEKATGEDPGLYEFINFLNDLVEEYSKPVRSTKTSRYVKILRTEARGDEVKANCILHKTASHSSSDCYTLKKMNYEQVKKLAYENKVCYRCLDPHMANKCNNDKVKCSKCEKNHATAMHPNQTFITRNPRQSRSIEEDVQPTTEEVGVRDSVNLCTSVDHKMKGSTCSKTVLVNIRLINTKKSYKCYCIIDEQSNTSLIDPFLLKYFNINPPETNYSMITLNGVKSNVKGHIVSGFEVKGSTEQNWIRLPSMFSNSSIPDTKFEIATSDIVSAHDHISHLANNFPNKVDNYRVLLLVGSNCGPAMATKPYGEHAPFVHHTSLGWALVGPICINPSNQGDSVVVLKTLINSDHFDAKIEFDKNHKSNYLNHSIEVDDEVPGLSKHDIKFNDIMNSSICVNSKGNLQMNLPLRDGFFFPDNKAAVFKRTLNTLNRLKKDKTKLEQCLSVMGSYLSNGHVRQIEPSCLEMGPGNVWYLPVFPVTHPKKNKCRLVFDSSATYQGTSLNGNLYQGPDNNNLLLGVLMRFRIGEIGYSCDIESMFHCFYVSPEHCNYLRFFWYDNNNPSNSIVQFQALVHVFGNSSSPAVANFGLRYAALNSPATAPSTSKHLINRSTYVDDSLGSSNSSSEAIETLRGAKELLSFYNIKLHKVVSSSPEVSESFPSPGKAGEAKVLFASEDGVTSTLGILWELDHDELTLRNVTAEKPFTKRGILSANGANFDPLGVTSPVTLGGRLFQRMILPPKSSSSNLWSTYDWDDPLPREFLEEWLTWVQSLTDLSKVKIPRGYVPLGFGPIMKQTIHMFCDASKSSIAYVAYMQSINFEGNLYNSFVLASSKVAPRMATSIPRLELCAAVEAATAARKISVELDIPMSSMKYYSDSKVLLGYLNNQEKTFKRYVTRRIENILSCSTPQQWCYVSTTINPADVGTKPHTPDELLRTNWLKGPEFLWRSEPLLNDSLDGYCELLPEELESKTVLASKISPCTSFEKSIVSEICLKTNSFNKAIHIARMLLKTLHFLDCAKQRIGIAQAPRTNDPKRSEVVKYLVRSSQLDSFNAELKIIENSSSMVENSKLSKLSPFIDSNNLLRVGGRLQNANIPYYLKHPIILEKNHPLTSLVLHDFHHKTMHAGRHITHGAVREGGYYITGGLSSIRDLVKGCVVCRALRAPPQTQYMADLPVDRLEEVPPFTYVGLDAFGPYHIHDGYRTRSSKTSKKMWGLLFTCLCSRAVHIEPLFNMDITSFRNALTRFWSIRGTCRKIRSDRGTNFVGAQNQMSEDMDTRKLKEFADSNGIEWEFTTPGASSHGGVWERKVGSIKSAMSFSLRQLNNRLLSRDELLTLFQEACQIVNNTPLWDFSPVPTESAPLSPASLLTLKEDPNPPPLDSFNKEDLLQYGKRRWRRVNYLADQFWSRWRSNYLNTLQCRYKWTTKNSKVNIGDVVLLKQKSKRNLWPVGIVTDFKRSKDGLIRSVTIKLAGDKPRFLERAIFDTVLLFPSRSPSTEKSGGEC